MHPDEAKKKLQELVQGKRVFAQAVSSEKSPLDKEKRTVELTFSSETPVKTPYYTEVLSHAPGACNLERMNNRGAFLLNHDKGKQIGACLEARTNPNGKRNQGTFQFSRKSLAEECMQDVEDGLLPNVSCFYSRDDFDVVEGENGEPPTIYVSKWTVLEVSLENIPADYSVGVGRSMDMNESEDQNLIELLSKININEGGSEGMKFGSRDQGQSNPAGTTDGQPKVIPNVINPEDILARERQRSGEISALGEKFGKREEANQALSSGMSIDEFKSKILEDMGKRGHPEGGSDPEPKPNTLGLSDQEAQQFSFLRAFQAQITGNWDIARMKENYRRRLENFQKEAM